MNYGIRVAARVSRRTRLLDLVELWRNVTMSRRRLRIPQTLRKMSKEDLAAWNESFREGTSSRRLGELEIQRRRAHANRVRNWIGIGIFVVALIVSIVVLGVFAR